MAHVTLVHGMANKPPADVMLKLWLHALARDDPKPEVHLPPNAGLDLGTIGASVDSVYWADVLYGTPETDVSGYERQGDERASIEGLPVDAAGATRRAASGQWRAELSPGEATFVRRLEEQLRFETAGGAVDADLRVVAAAVVERIPLPDFIKRPLMEMLLRDVHHYIFNTEFSPRPGESYRIRDELQRRFLEHVIAHADDRPHHRLWRGAMLTYGCLRNRPDCPPIDGLITLGSPLGLDEVQDAVAPKGNRVSFPNEKLEGPWINIFDPLDPVVGFDPRFANDYLRDGVEAVVDFRESNWGQWRHNIVKYLSGPRMRSELKRLLAGAPSASHAKTGARRVAVAGRDAVERESVRTPARAGTSRAPGTDALLKPTVAAGLAAPAIARLDRQELARLADEATRAGTLEGTRDARTVVALASALRGRPSTQARSRQSTCATVAKALTRLYARALIEGRRLTAAATLLQTRRFRRTGRRGCSAASKSSLRQPDAHG